jgi:4-aminobutyrate aminotransferase/(S)-3-amino-2-methylpropionate transaminase
MLDRPPGPRSRSLLDTIRASSAPMGPAPKAAGAPFMIFAEGFGSNVLDPDGNRYVDLAAGFGALLLGHRPPNVVRAVEHQSKRLLLALGDVFSSDVKAELSARLAALYPEEGARVIVAQSGADALTAAIKTAALATGRPGIIAFRGGYHGLSYAPLAVSSLRQSYGEPFRHQLNPHVRLVDFPTSKDRVDEALTSVSEALRTFETGAVLVEPILGRAGVVIPPPGFLAALGRLAHERGALLVADEVWTGLGRSGAMLFSVAEGAVPDIICLGKGLGGGVPASACIGSDAVMRAWQRAEEVVHTSTFAGAPLACTAALATLDVLVGENLPARSASVGARFLEKLESALHGLPGVVGVRGRGLMIGVDLAAGPGGASVVQGRLLEKGYIVSTGGGRREVLVLTPSLNVDESLLMGFVPVLVEVLRDPVS